MFELGKKDGSERADELSARADSADTSASPTRAGSSTGSDVAVIGRSIRIDGDLRGEEDLRIEGDVNGTVRLDNHTLTIGGEGKMRADVYAKSVIIDGHMEGDLHSSERVEIRKNATVHGNITAPRVSLEDGAKFRGSIEMDPQAVEAALGVGAGVGAVPKRASKSKANGGKPAAQSQADDEPEARDPTG